MKAIVVKSAKCAVDKRTPDTATLPAYFSPLWRAVDDKRFHHE
jgi:hypothetical protein